MKDSGDEVDLEAGRSSEIEPNLERDCRICQLNLEGSDGAIELGCACKDDLAAAHKQCAETWFKIKGNKTCEICGSNAKNVVTVGEIEATEHLNETSIGTEPPASAMEPRGFWQGRHIRNFLLGCTVVAFLISWIFHFNVGG